MKIFWEIYVTDMEESKKFYAKVIGLTVERQQDDFMVMEGDGIILHLCPLNDLPDPLLDTRNSRLGGRVEFCFETEEIEKAYELALGSGYAIIEELRNQPWGKTDFRVIDPDGAYIRVTSPQIRRNDCLKASDDII